MRDLFPADWKPKIRNWLLGFDARVDSGLFRSFATLRKLPCDVFIAAHGPFYDLEGKYAKLGKGGLNPFIDHAGYLAYIDLKEKQFNDELARQKAGGKP